MSGPNEVPVPSEHPNNDLLADLAAEVLPEDLAGHVQHHVQSCALCAGLLADAEGVRQMLLQVEPEEMPDEVLLRIEQALVTARREDEAAIAGEAGETRLLSRVPSEAGRADPARRIGRSGPATGRIPATGPMTGAITTGPKTGRLNRMAAPAQSARRQAIEERKADTPSRFAQAWPVLRIAAAVLVVAGLGVGAVQVLGIGSDSSDSAVTAAAGTNPEAVVVAPVQSTTTNYTRRSMNTQIKSLISTSQKLLNEGPASTDQVQKFGESDQASAPDVAPKAVPDASDASASPAAQSTQDGQDGQLLRSSEALQACLAAIGAEQVQPVAVDLARYGGREAAIIVLPVPDGLYDVWVVSRNCRAGGDGDGAIAVINNVKP